MDRVVLNCLWRVTESGTWLTAIPYCLNGMELSREEFQDNLLLRYGIVPLKLPTDCDGCRKEFSVTHDLSCSKGGMVLVWHKYAAKDLDTPLARDLNPSYISYTPKINSRTVQGGSNGARA